MTRLPLEDRSVEGYLGDFEIPYPLNAVCAAPGCRERVADRHHLWRRSALGGPYEWVRIPGFDGIVGNLVGLCRFHHEQVTVNAAWVTLEEDEFRWTTLIEGTRSLDWQPPQFSSEELGLGGGEESHTSLPVAPDASEICPSCKRPLPHAKHNGQPEQKRPRRTWSVTVPVDERENGADTLDALLVASREEMAKAGLPYGEEDAVKFFVLSAALGLFVQHAEEVLG